MGNTRSIALLALIVVALLACANGAYLTQVHIDLDIGKAGASAVCHQLAKDGCTVTGGRFGSLFGIPVALFGFAGAVTILFTAIRAFRHRGDDLDPSLALLVLLGFFVVAVSLLMAAFSYIENSYCPFCVIWYGLNTATAILAWLAWSNAATPHDRSPLSCLLVPAARIPAFVWPGLSFIAAFAVAFSVYASKRNHMLELRTEMTRSVVQQLKGEKPKIVVLDGQPLVAPEVDGKPPEVTLIEFSDFQCPYCRRFWKRAKRLKELSKRSISVVHINYPLDQACNPRVTRELHTRACAAAEAAECARDQQAFEAYADLLFDHQSADELGDEQLLDYAKSVGLDIPKFSSCLKSDAIKERLQKHMQAGIDLGINSTPTVLINGYPFPANISAPILNVAIENLLDPSIKPKSAEDNSSSP